MVHVCTSSIVLLVEVWMEILALSCGFWGFYDLLGVFCSTLLGNC